MAGRGPAPKPAGQRARANSEPFPVRIITAQPATRPELPDTVNWPERTREWWDMWGRSPLAAEFTETDWSELMDTALLHAAYWSGDLRQAAELRLRVAKFGATPEDRARLRIQFATADQVDPDGRKPGHGAGSARARRGPYIAIQQAASND